MSANYTAKKSNPALKPAGVIDVDFGGRGTTSSPSWVKVATTAGNSKYLFVDTNNRLRMHTAVPTANTDGTVIDQSYADALTDTSTVAKYTTGALRTDSNGYVYKYVKNIDLTAADGWALTAGSASNPSIVSGDRSGGSAINTVPVGVAIGALPLNSFGWVMVHGYKANVLSDGSVAVGEGLIAHGTTDGGVDSAASASTVVITVHQIFGLALANDTTTRVKAMVRCL